MDLPTGDPAETLGGTSGEGRDGTPADPPCPASHPVYPGLGRRLAAWGIDLLAANAFLFTITILLALGGANIAAIGTPTTLWGLAALVAYMTAATLIFSTTLGKYLLGMEVRGSDGLTARKPQILLRETVGRLGILIFACGYWRAPSDPRRRAWCDHLADTAVVRRRRTAWVTGVLVAVAALSLCTTLWSLYLTQVLPPLDAALTANVARAQAAWAKVQGDLGQRQPGETLAQTAETLGADSANASAAQSALIRAQRDIRSLLWILPVQRRGVDRAIAVNALRLRQINVYRREARIMPKLARLDPDTHAYSLGRRQSLRSLRKLDRQLQALQRRIMLDAKNR